MRDPVKSLIWSALRTVPLGRSLNQDRWGEVAQPRNAPAQCLISVLRETGTENTGKVSKYSYFAPFVDVLRREGMRTHFCHSHLELELHLRRGIPTVLINLFGEDDCQIHSERMQRIEDRCAVVYNSAESGRILADKVLSEEVLRAHGVLMPPNEAQGREVFVRKRLGSGAPTRRADGAQGQPAEDEVARAFIDTRVDYAGEAYYTSVRVMCCGDAVLHPFPRARPVSDEDPNVKTKNTPLDPDLIEFMHRTLVAPYTEQFATIARQAHEALGHGFCSHDLMIERDTGLIYMCESGFKFDDRRHSSRMKPIEAQVPSQAPIVSTEAYAVRSAYTVLAQCSAAFGLEVSDEVFEQAAGNGPVTGLPS